MDLSKLHEVLHQLLGLSSKAEELAFYQIAARAFIVYVALLVVMRSGKKRFLGRGASAFDVALVITLGSIAARAISGNTAFFGSIVGLAVLVFVHWEFLDARARIEVQQPDQGPSHIADQRRQSEPEGAPRRPYVGRRSAGGSSREGSERRRHRCRGTPGTQRQAFGDHEGIELAGPASKLLTQKAAIGPRAIVPATGAPARDLTLRAIGDANTGRGQIGSSTQPAVQAFCSALHRIGSAKAGWPHNTRIPAAAAIARMAWRLIMTISARACFMSSHCGSGGERKCASRSCRHAGQR